MRARIVLSLAFTTCVGCTLITSLDDLQGSTDASAESSVDGAPDASADAPVEASTDGSADVLGDVANDAGLGDASDPIASWTFDEDGGTTIHDVTGHGHDGVLIGGAWVGGHSGSAVLLNGSSDFVAVPSSPDFDKGSTSSFSITAWVMRIGTFSHDAVMSIAFGPTSAEYGLEAQSDTLMNYWDGVAHIATGTAVMVAGEWHHLAIVVSGGAAATSYFDGSQVATGAGDTTSRSCTAVRLGASNYGDFFPGAIDNIRFWGHALTPQEVAADMVQ